MTSPIKASTTCCICRKSARKNPKSFLRSSTYESDFECCFGPEAENRSGWLCSTCKYTVATQYPNNRDKTHHELIDSKGKVGYHGHSKHGIKKSASCRPTVTPSAIQPRNVMQDIKNTPSYRPNTHDHSYSIGILEKSFNTPNSICDTPAANKRVAVSRPRSRKRLVELMPTLTEEHNSGLPSCTPMKVRKLQSHDKLNSSSLSTDFFGHCLPLHVAKAILGYFEKLDIVNLMNVGSAQHTVNKALLFDELSIRYDVQNKEREELLRKTTISATDPLTQSQKEFFSQLVRNKQRNLDKDGLIVVNHRRGKPTKLLEIPSTQEASSNAAASTLTRRSKIIEKVTHALAKPSTTAVNVNKDNNVHAQMVSMIKRNKSAYADAAKDAGLDIVGRFTKETVLAMRAAMTQTMWRLIRRVLRVEIGHDVLISENN